MNWDQVQGKWQQAKGDVKKRWGSYDYYSPIWRGAGTSL